MPACTSDRRINPAPFSLRWKGPQKDPAPRDSARLPGMALGEVPSTPPIEERSLKTARDTEATGDSAQFGRRRSVFAAEGSIFAQKQYPLQAINLQTQ